MRLSLVTATLLACPVLAFGAGSDDPEPPKTTATTSQCTAPQIYDPATQSCVDAQESRLDDDTRYDAVRELAYAAEYTRALQVLATMSDQSQSRVWTYKGFIARKTGKTDLAMQYYQAALDVDADNILARSYMGQGLVMQGQSDAARVQLSEIRARGGRNTWAEYALRTALESAKTYSY